METILVTGGAGYIGLHLVSMLKTAGYDVIVLDNLSTGQNHPLLKNILINAEVGNSTALENIFKKHHITIIIHLAALTNVNESINVPLNYYENNICQTFTLLEQSIKHNIQYFIFASSAAVFSHTSCNPVDETQVTRPTTPYGRTKRLIECALRDCYKAYKLNSIIFRYFNVAGSDEKIDLLNKKRQWSQLIPRVLETAAEKNNCINVYGDQHETPDGTCLRDYIHVNDICSAHLLAIKKLPTLNGCFTYHLGSGKGTSVKEIIQKAQDVTQKPIKSIVSPARVADSACVIANNNLAKTTFNWTAKCSDISTILNSSWKWMR
jgi:UDP-glucose 4-epimerase